MPKEFFQRSALGLAIIMLGAWGVTLIVAPDRVSALFSGEPANRASAGMMGAALLGLAVVSLASISRRVGVARALGIAMLILVGESAYLMLGTEAMLVTPPTTISLVSAAAVAFFLLI